MGGNFTAKMEGMLNEKQNVDSGRGDPEFDMLLESALSEQQVAKVEFNAAVLTLGHWPTFKKFAIKLPEPMNRYYTVTIEFNSCSISSVVNFNFVFHYY